MKVLTILVLLALLSITVFAWQNETQVPAPSQSKVPSQAPAPAQAPYVQAQVQPFGAMVTAPGPSANEEQMVTYYLTAGRFIQLNISSVSAGTSFVLQQSTSNPLVSTSQQCICAPTPAENETQLQQYQANLPGALNFFTLYIQPSAAQAEVPQETPEQQQAAAAQEQAAVQSFKSVSVTYNYLPSDVQAPPQVSAAQRQVAAAAPSQFVFWHSQTKTWVLAGVSAVNNQSANSVSQELSSENLQVGANTFAVINTAQNLVGFSACSSLCTAVPAPAAQQEAAAQQQANPRQQAAVGQANPCAENRRLPRMRRMRL